MNRTPRSPTGRSLSIGDVVPVGCGLALTVALGLFAPAVGGETRLNGHAFRLPDGYAIEIAAGAPLVERPIVADFDEDGRLYVAESSGTNDPVGKQLAEKPHKILRLEDSDGDGRFDRRTVFADRMMFPEGAMWLDGSLFVAAPPSIWKLTDVDGDGVADRREEWFQGKTLTGCANDLHGPYAGPDGWVYWCKGAFAPQTYERPGRSPLVTRAAHVFRARPDGTGVEPVMTGGMDNPVDVVFTTGGERIFSCTFLQHPGGGRRDGLIHAVYGGVYGKVHDVLDGHVRTGPDVMPVLAHLGPAAPAGLAAYESDAFGPGSRGDLFACNFNLQKVTRHTLSPRGATFASRDETFLASDRHDFHPTDVIEDADGSLLVIDTGGWYKLCCPTSVLHKPDVLGAIYRVTKDGAPKIDDPGGCSIAWSSRSPRQLVGLLDDPRPAVRRRAVRELGKRGDEAVPALAEGVDPSKPVEVRRDSVWASVRVDGEAARGVARRALSDPDETVRQASAHASSVRVDRGALPGLTALLKSPPMPNRRVAAEAIGRIGDASAVPALLDAAEGPTDRVLEHALTYALVEIHAPEPTLPGLRRSNPTARRVALVALDQLGAPLNSGDVAPGLASSDPATRETASWVVGRHPEWAGDLAGFFRKRLASADLSEAEREELAGQLARFAATDSVRDLLAETVDDDHAPQAAVRVSLRAMASSGLKTLPDAWAKPLARRVGRGDRDALAVARSLPSKSGELNEPLVALGGRSEVEAGLRLEALAAVPGGLKGVGPDLFAFLRDRLGADRPVSERLAAAGVLAGASLDRGQQLALAESVRTAGPLELGKLLGAFEKTTDEEVGLRLVDALKPASATGSIRAETIKPVLDRFGPKVRDAAGPLYLALNADAGAQKARIDAILPGLTAGDERRGQAVFNGPKAACRSCHALGYVGGNVGPDLSKVGAIRNERDLVEAIVYPSLSFVRSYEPVSVATASGKVVSGVLRKDAADEVVVATGADEEARIPRAEVEEMRPGTVSLMPAGLDSVLSRQELADLIAFLKSRK